MHKRTCCCRFLKVKDRLAAGTFGEVFKGTWQGSEVAIKRMKYERLNEQLKEEFKNEIQILVS